MEEEKKKKALKIIKIIRYILIGILVIGLTITSIISCKKTKAEELPINYYNYTTLVSIEDVQIQNGVYEGSLYILGTIQNNKVQYEPPSIYEFICEEAILLNGPYETYGASSIEIDKAYLITYIQDGHDWEIQSASEYNTYIGWALGDKYDDGYVVGTNAEKQEAYQQGYQAGKEDTITSYTQQLNEQQQIYNNQLEQKNETIAQQQETINHLNGTNNWGNFKSLLGLIMTYPIQFFKEGLNVNVFGVNVGGFLLGIGMLIILSTLIGLILGKIRR